MANLLYFLIYYLCAHARFINGKHKNDETKDWDKILYADADSCCAPHTAQEQCENEAGSDCLFVEGGDPIIAIAGSQCVSFAFVNAFGPCAEDTKGTNDDPAVVCTKAVLLGPPPPGPPPANKPVCGPAPTPKPTTPRPTPKPTTPSPTPPPTALCELNRNYDFNGYPCQISGDPHTKKFNGDNHDFQGQPLTLDENGNKKNQFYYIHTCSEYDETSMPFNILGTHYHWGHRVVSGIDYLTLELFDDNNDIYYVYLSSHLHSYVKSSDIGASTDYDITKVNGVTMTALIGGNTVTSIGNIFTISFNQVQPQKSITAKLKINHDCEVFIYMIGQTGDSTRYRMHYIYIKQSDCFKCATCGLCGDFQNSKASFTGKLKGCNDPSSSDDPDKLKYKQLNKGWNEQSTPEAYDPDGITWEYNHVKQHCTEDYDVTDNNGDFEFTDPCRADLKSSIETKCNAKYNSLTECCSQIGDKICSDLLEDCYVDACAAVGNNGIDPTEDEAVNEIFADAVDGVCNDAPPGKDFEAIFKYLGCYRDKSERAMTNIDWDINDGKSLTPEEKIVSCEVKCAREEAGYRYFAVQYKKECFCSNDLAVATKYGTYHSCADGIGGGWGNDLYENMNFNPAPAAIKNKQHIFYRQSDTETSQLENESIYTAIFGTMSIIMILCIIMMYYKGNKYDKYVEIADGDDNKNKISV